MINEYNLLNGDVKLSEHFKLSEFQCKDGSKKILLDDDLVEVLESLRQFIGKPITILSGYRTQNYNIKCGGASNSYHCKGMASDIRADIPLTKLAIYSAMMGARGIGIYSDQNFIHVDTREDRIVFKEK